jgi:hypothetical protein
MQSRNKREGRFIPGWCYNPNLSRALGENGCPLEKIRAGSYCDIKRVKNKEVGECWIRVLREGAYV